VDEKKVSRREQKCISKCILIHWSELGSTPRERREDEYEQCLYDCQVCR